MSTGHSQPRRRQTSHVETLHDERCVYEWTTKTVHALNPAAARVWEMCDGSTTVDQMTAAVRRDLDASHAEAIVQHALAQFERAGLLEPDTLPGETASLSRRALLRRIGAAAAIPVVTSIAAPTPLAAQSGGNSQTFTFTGAPQSFIVPAGVTSLQVDVRGASGGGVSPTPPGAFGNGGRVQATLPVTAGETLTIVVGGAGSNSGGGGFNGGGPGGSGGYGGGGASDIRRGSTLLVVAGGGGGGGTLIGGNGGWGGGLAGGSGTGFCGNGGGGGTQSAGGAGGGSDSGGFSGSPGTAGTGGQGAAGNPPTVLGASGGGGGLFGGGGAGACSTNSGGGGGGGSSFTDPSATSVVHTQGFNTGNGVVTVSW